MKKHIVFECEICGGRYNTEQGAIDCESRGLGPEYPIGCVFGNHTPGDLYSGITFAVAGNDTKWKHYNDLILWACRDNRHGDSLGDEKCGGCHTDLRADDAKINKEHPTFKRMIAWLKSRGIPITIWDGTKAVPYELQPGE